jgi:hypothetical protein
VGEVFVVVRRDRSRRDSLERELIVGDSPQQLTGLVRRSCAKPLAQASRAAGVLPGSRSKPVDG